MKLHPSSHVRISRITMIIWALFHIWSEQDTSLGSLSVWLEYCNSVLVFLHVSFAPTTVCIEFDFGMPGSLTTPHYICPEGFALAWMASNTNSAFSIHTLRSITHGDIVVPSHQSSLMLLDVSKFSTVNVTLFEEPYTAVWGYEIN